MDCWLCMTAQPAPVIEECLALRARVAKLEAALHDVLPYVSSTELKVATEIMLKGAPQ